MAGFGQVVIGPPGSGKSTYCIAMRDFLRSLGRKVALVNLDPANDYASCDIDLRELISLSDCMQRLQLGPNGSMLYCMEFLEQNISWLQDKLQAMPSTYFLFDCPGQIELYTHHSSVRNIVDTMQTWGLRLCAVNLVDSVHCSDAAKFISLLLTSLSTMMQLELPHVNVLSKLDLVESMGPLDFSLEYYTDVLDLSFLLDRIADTPFAARYRALTKALTELVEDFSLVRFCTLNVQDKETMASVLQEADKANGYAYGAHAPGGEQNLLETLGISSSIRESLSRAQSKYSSS